MSDTMQKLDSNNHAENIMGGLRTFGANYAEFTKNFAAWMSLHSSDASALVEILYAEDIGEPLSPVRLSERIQLTSGATSAVLNRLESAGHIVRSHEAADRRVVTLRSSRSIQKPAIKFFMPLSQHMDRMLEHYSESELLLVEKFLGQLEMTMAEALSETSRLPKP